MENSKLRKGAYEKYQLDFMLKRGISLTEFVEELLKGESRGSAKEYFDEFACNSNGFQGELWVCYDEFLENEYLDVDYMEYLLSEKEFEQYTLEQNIISSTSKKILETEYCKNFDDKRKKAMITSFYKYGRLKDNYSGENPNVDAIKSLQIRLDEYRTTGNTEYLVDVANFAMMEFMYPHVKGAAYRPSDSSNSPGLAGLSVNEAKRFMEMEG